MKKSKEYVMFKKEYYILATIFVWLTYPLADTNCDVSGCNGIVHITIIYQFITLIVWGLISLAVMIIHCGE